LAVVVLVIRQVKLLQQFPVLVAVAVVVVLSATLQFLLLLELHME
jgi:hypothetical protein